jgi:hypothetical protein
MNDARGTKPSRRIEQYEYDAIANSECNHQSALPDVSALVAPAFGAWDQYWGPNSAGGGGIASKTDRVHSLNTSALFDNEIALVRLYAGLRNTRSLISGCLAHPHTLERTGLPGSNTGRELIIPMIIPKCKQEAHPEYNERPAAATLQ